MDYRTDLALEKSQQIDGKLPDGVTVSREDSGRVKITTIEVKDKQAAKKLSKPIGKYTTLSLPEINASVSENKDIIEIVADKIRELVPENGTVMVTGLGNDDITPDAVGPKTAEGVLSTRHIAQNESTLNFRSVASFCPSVLGKTGIETRDVIKSVCKQIDASCVIAVDALASKSVSRLGCTVQICDTGICPGSGVGNSRAEISQKTIGVPVIAVGVPTVIDALTLALDITQNNGSEPCLDEKTAKMMVTVREIDTLVSSVSKILSLAINRALQKDFSVDELYFISM